MTWQFVVLILFLHWVFDFVFQTDYMARNKSKSIKALASHVAIYSLLGGGGDYLCLTCLEKMRTGEMSQILSKMTSETFKEYNL